MDLRAMAIWLTNMDGNGASDEEFAEFVALTYLIWKKQDPNLKLSKEELQNLDVEDLVNTLKGIMDEIVFSDEIDPSCWWKQEEGACYV